MKNDKVCPVSNKEKTSCIHCKDIEIDRLKNNLLSLKNNKCLLSNSDRKQCLHCKNEELNLLNILVNTWNKEQEIINLKHQVNDWKDAWYVQREATGKSFWEGAKIIYDLGKCTFEFYGLENGSKRDL